MPPGCNGEGNDDFDYCFDFLAFTCTDPDPLTVCEIGDDGHPAKFFPLAECRGDCDDDSECEGSLLCGERHEGDAYPGCESDGEEDDNDTDFCFDFIAFTCTVPDQVCLVGDDGHPSKLFPLGLCQGDVSFVVLFRT